MRRALTFARILGIPVLPTESVATDIAAALDALNTGDSLKGHWPMSTTAARIGPAPITVVGTHETGLPEIAAGGGNSRALDGSEDYGTIALTSNADFLGPAGTVIAFVQLDQVDVKQSIVNLNSGSLAGSFSLEIEANGVPRVFKRHLDGQNTNVRGSAGLVAAGRPQLIAATWGTDGLKLYVMDHNRAPGEILDSSTVFQSAWPSNVPAASPIYVGRWQGGETSFFDGVVGHLAWFSRQLSPAELQTLAPLLRQVAYMPSFNAGSVQEGNAIAISLEDRGHPIDGFTAQVTSPAPSIAGSTVVVQGPPSLGVSYTAGQITATSQADSFGVTITANGQVSAPATVSLTVTDTPAVQPPVANPDSQIVTAGVTPPPIQVLSNDTNVPSGATIELVTNPGGRFARVSNNTQVQFTPPSSVPDPEVHTGSYRVVGSTGTSNTTNIAVTVNPAGLGFTPFAFVTQRMPTITHNGGTTLTDVRARPPFNASDPPSAYRICPMSKLRFWRLTPNPGVQLLLNGSTPSGAFMGGHLKGENNVTTMRVWNCDGSLCLWGESGTSSQDPTNKAVMALLDVNGTHGNSGPWRFLRVWRTRPGVLANNYMWDWVDPERCFVFENDGLYEWFPKTGVNNTVGTKQKLFNWPSGLHGFTADSHQAKSAWSGDYQVFACIRTSDNAPGGVRIKVRGSGAGSADAFRPHPDPGQWSQGIKRGVTFQPPDGIVGGFAHAADGEPKVNMFQNFQNGAKSPIWGGAKAMGGHQTLFLRDGVMWLLGSSGSGGPIWKGLKNDANGTMVGFGNDFNIGTEHAGTGAFKDLWETALRNPNDGHPTSGLRYGLISVSSPEERAGIMGLRLGNGDVDQWRYIINHRSYRSGNRAECHPQVSPDFKWVLFNSNWVHPGVETSEELISNYVVQIPDAWRSPNNSGL